MFTSCSIISHSDIACEGRFEDKRNVSKADPGPVLKFLDPPLCIIVPHSLRQKETRPS